MVTFGVDHLKEYKQWLSDAKVGLLTNITGRDSKNESTINVLKRMCNLTVLFGPEHGVRGDFGAGEHVDSYTDPVTGLLVYSLYGGTGKHFTQEMLDSFDVLVYDIQDIGVRFFTYISTLYHVLQDLSNTGKTLIILDRPNPLGGDEVEGNVLDMKFCSFVGCYPMPIRYGLTCAEAALMMNTEQQLGCDIKVIPCEGWKRSSLFSDWGKVWLPPSPALTSFETTLLYPGICLLEGTNLSEGRGTAAPFRMIGADFIESEELMEVFNCAKLEGVTATPAWFTPTTSKHQGVKCGGILLHVTDQSVIKPVKVGITLLDIIRKLYPKQYQSLAPYRVGGRPMLALLSGNDTLLNNWDMNELLEQYEKDSNAFIKRKHKFHLYS